MSAPNKLGITLVDLKYGDPGAPVYHRVCDDTRDLAIGTDIYVGRPAMEVRIGPLTGGLNEKPTEIDLPLEIGEFADTVSDGSAHSMVRVRVRELEIDPDGTTRIRTFFLGTLYESVRNPDGRDGIVRLVCRNAKSDLDYAVGLAANPTCAWNLGEAGCEIDLAPLTVQATVQSTSGIAVVVDDGAGPSGPLRGKAAGYWVRGSLRRGGLHVLIKDWETGSTNFVVAQPIPATWVGEIVVVVPGCDQRRTTCDVRWGNLNRFAGSGIAMPAHNPLFEVPS